MSDLKFAVGIILDPNNQALLQKKDMGYPWGPGKWCFFGGQIEKGESGEKAFAREMEEENSLVLENVKYFDEYEFRDEITIPGTTLATTTKCREGTFEAYAARFDGDLEKVRLREGAGFAIYAESELESLEELMFDHNFRALSDFYQALRTGDLKF